MKAQEKILELATGTLEQVEVTFHQAYQEGIFDRWFPGFKDMEGCQHRTSFKMPNGIVQIIHREGDVLIHTGKVLAHSSQITEDILTESDRYILTVAALLHDIKKPKTRGVEDSGKVTFYGHAEEAAYRCFKFASHICMTQSEADGLKWVVGNHMNAHFIPTYSEEKRMSFYQSPYFPILKALQAADSLGTWVNDDGTEHMPVYCEFFTQDVKRLFGS